MDYKEKILVLLVKKFNRRKLKYKDKEINQRIYIKPTEIYKKYASGKGEMETERSINNSIDELESIGFVTMDKKKYSYDVSKVYLNDKKIDDINIYLFEKYGITSRYFLIEEAKNLVKKYRKEGPLTEFYSNQLIELIENTLTELNLVHEEQIFLALAFIQNNKENLFLREASMLIYGTSKVLEDKAILEPVCNIIRQVLDKPKSEYESNDEILKDYHISNVDQEILIKGDISIVLDGYCLEIKYFKDGISLTSSDIDRIQSIAIHTKNFMTIENKTSFYRFNDSSFSILYLGGYANRHQIAFLKKMFELNPEVKYFHFGDLDIGGFLIHQHLCNSTGITFNLFKMGIEELQDEQYKTCLQNLTENDKLRSQSLLNVDLYRDRIDTMLKENAKLEQEIISLTLDKS